ncbi:hypothetical protein JCM21714_3502 [Gracilibacillus boraciitolerans JCM 21714]|uniref:Glycoside hydrolase family 31 N-terminal domain-containing protein n=1 Tax=Gracilibacillus boraciitolerans JCM 21714 TaxID=1298598 RepID=W4VMD2_9BACI|nr:DUF4968 domain-containing protein [Gracilibacillus boraciitolerans]GAE94351.1 hypothetical protein JCM21714_3502 [Gracilibacillus boraciitolerans JCM 21714]
MEIEKCINQKDYLLIECRKGLIKIIPYTESIIRIRYTLENQFSEKESLFVEQNTQQNIHYSVEEKKDIIVFSTRKVHIQINKNTAAFTYMNASGGLLTKEPKRGGKTLVPTEVLKPVYDENTEIENSYNVDGGARAKAVTTEHV